MGGTRFNARGVDHHGNAANFVETEQLIIKHVEFEEMRTTFLSSFVQVRGSVPLYWMQDGLRSKVRLTMDLETSEDACRTHFEKLRQEYGNKIVVANLLMPSKEDENMLIEGY